MINIMWGIHTDQYRFDRLLASVGLFVWLRLFLGFRITETFGPMFKIIYKMLIELFKFLIILFLVIFIFTCVSVLFFNQLDAFSNIIPVLEYWFYAALGNWDNNAFAGQSDDGSSTVFLQAIGEFY